MSTPTDPVIISLIEAQSGRAKALAQAVMARLEAGANPEIMETSRLLERAKVVAANNAPVILEARKVQAEVNEFMDKNCPKTMWDSNDVRELNPALAQKHLDINTQHRQGADELRVLTEQVHNTRVGAYKAISKLTIDEMKQAIAQGQDEGVGTNFVTAYIAAGMVRDQLLGANGSNSPSMLNEFFRYAINARGKATGVNFYEGNSMAEVIGKGLGMKSAKDARAVLFEVYAEKSNALPPAQTPSSDAPGM